MGFFDKIQETITSATEQTKAKAQDVQLKREKSQKLAQLGEQTYGLFLSGQLTNQELMPACQEIADLDRRIAEAEAAAAAARPQPVPPGAPGGYAPAQPGTGATGSTRFTRSTGGSSTATVGRSTTTTRSTTASRADGGVSEVALKSATQC